MSKKKKTTRSRAKSPALEKRFNSKKKQEYIDFDEKYLADLEKDPEAKAWLDKFSEEFHNGRLAHKYGDPFHNTPELRKNAYDRNNWLQRDMLSGIKALDPKHMAALESYKIYTETLDIDVIDFEERFIDFLDKGGTTEELFSQGFTQEYIDWLEEHDPMLYTLIVEMAKDFEPTE